MSVASYCRRIATAFFFFSSLGTALAQSLTVGDGVSLTAGTSTTVAYRDPHRGGQTVVVTIASDGPSPVTQEHFLQLDASGQGSFSWKVPGNWDKAYFNAPGATEVAMAVL